MGFRNDRKSSMNWKKWKKSHQQLLNDIDIPGDIYDSESRWWYFLEHGYDHETKWSTESLSIKDVQLLLIFLENEYQNHQAFNCIKDLKRKISEYQ